MASVRLSDRLLSDVRRNINSLFVNRFQKIHDQIQAFGRANLDKMYKLIFSPEELETMKSLPTDWLPKVEDIQLRIADDKDPKQQVPETIPYNIDIKVSPVAKPYYLVPQNMRSSYRATELKATIYDSSLYVEFHRLKQIYRQVEEEKEAIEKQVKTIFKELNTVKQALKAWPQFEHLLPVDVMELVNEKRTPQTRKRIAAGDVYIDTSVNAVFLKAKIET